MNCVVVDLNIGFRSAELFFCPISWVLFASFSSVVLAAKLPAFLFATAKDVLEQTFAGLSF